MGQILFTDKIGTLTYSNPNVNMLSSISSPSYITIGGQQYTVTANLSVSTGSLTLQSLYYVYAVQTAGVVSIVISTNVNSVGPAGFNSWKLIGAFYTDISAAFSAFVSNKAQTASTITSLSVVGSGTYTTPPQSIMLKIQAVGGGGGGGSSNNAGGTNGGGGSGTGFGGIITANGGNGGQNAGPLVAGGTVSTSAPVIVINAFNGQPGLGGQFVGAATGAQLMGGAGGSNPLGVGGTATYGGGATAAAQGFGAGGAGAGNNGTTNTYSASGGASGGYVEAIIPNPISSYSYSVGNFGAGGTGAGLQVGGAGTQGIIIIEEIKPNLEQLRDL